MGPTLSEELPTETLRWTHYMHVVIPMALHSPPNIVSGLPIDSLIWAPYGHIWYLPMALHGPNTIGRAAD